MFKKRIINCLLICLFLALTVFSQESSVSNEHLQVSLDTVWTLIAAFMVFFMQAGFAMVESGFTRAKNASNIMMKLLRGLLPFVSFFFL